MQKLNNSVVVSVNWKMPLLNSIMAHPMTHTHCSGRSFSYSNYHREFTLQATWRGKRRKISWLTLLAPYK